MHDGILKTLTYFDYFDYPLKAWEIHKWLTQKKGSLKQTEKALKKLVQEKKVIQQREYYFLNKKKNLVALRIKKEKISASRLNRAKAVSILLKIIPWVKLVGVTGSLSMLSSQKKDDIDFFIITSSKRIWISRLFLLSLITLTGMRRKRREKLLSASGKICINLILETDNLAQQNRNIYLAHEVLQMRVLWQRAGIYSKFLNDNNWAFKYLPNWKSGILDKGKGLTVKGKVDSNDFVDLLEEMARNFQLKIMDSPRGFERIENGALYFHPEDKGKKILERYDTIIKHGL